MCEWVPTYWRLKLCIIDVAFCVRAMWKSEKEIKPPHFYFYTQMQKILHKIYFRMCSVVFWTIWWRFDKLMSGVGYEKLNWGDVQCILWINRSEISYAWKMERVKNDTGGALRWSFVVIEMILNVWEEKFVDFYIIE